MTYTEFCNRLLSCIVLDEESDDGWLAYLPAIVEQATLRCCRDADFLALRRVASFTVAADAGQFTAPADYMMAHRISVVVDGQRLPVSQRDESFLWEFAGAPGWPRYWAEPEAGRIVLAPAPDVACEGEIAYTARPALLSADNPETWLSRFAPDLFFYAAMVSATGYLKNYGAQSDDPRSGLSWEAQYQAALPGVKREESRRKGEPAFEPSPSPASPQNAPAGA